MNIQNKLTIQDIPWYLKFFILVNIIFWTVFFGWGLTKASAHELLKVILMFAPLYLLFVVWPTMLLIERIYIYKYRADIMTLMYGFDIFTQRIGLQQQIMIGWCAIRANSLTKHWKKTGKELGIQSFFAPNINLDQNYLKFHERHIYFIKLVKIDMIIGGSIFLLVFFSNVLYK